MCDLLQEEITVVKPFAGWAMLVTQVYKQTTQYDPQLDQAWVRIPVQLTKLWTLRQE